MFNGIIKNTGIINRIYKKNNNCFLYVLSKIKLTNKEIGSSISCSGTCLTLSKYNRNLSKFYISKETLNKTIFKTLKKGDIINLEKALKYGERISGHFVQGHIDTTALVVKIVKVGKSIVIKFIINKKFNQYIVYKGSITINGISLTVSKIIKNGFEVSIVPHTLKLTDLRNLKKNKLVNVEFDILGKYIKKFIK